MLEKTNFSTKLHFIFLPIVKELWLPFRRVELADSFVSGCGPEFLPALRSVTQILGRSVCHDEDFSKII